MLKESTLLFLSIVCLTLSSSYPDKKCLLDYFKSVEGKKVLSGSFGGFNHYTTDLRFSMAEAEGIFNLTNKYPAIYAMDCGLGWVATEPGHEADLVDCYHEDLIEHAKKGGIITLNQILPNPILPGNVVENKNGYAFERRLSNEEFRKLLTKGTPERDYLFRMYDKIAEGIATYKANGITVLYRPYQEMNAKAFWWANTDDEEKDEERIELFKSFWKELHNYFTIDKGLNNIIWIYSSFDGSKFRTDFYPGDEYVDMVGLSVYLNDFLNVQGYDEMLTLGKPLAFAEVGPMHASYTWLPFGKLDYEDMIDKLNKYYPKVIYFLAWNGMWSPIRNDFAKEAFNNERVLNIDDLKINCNSESQSPLRSEL